MLIEYFCIICIIYNEFSRLRTRVIHAKYIWSNVATRLLQRLSQTSSAQLSSNVLKTLCVSWVGREEYLIRRAHEVT